jgi:hypothetical protein
MAIEAAAEGIAGLDEPLTVTFEKPGLLDQPEKMRLLDEVLEVSDVVPSEFVIFEIHPEPGPTLAVVDVESARFRVVRHDEEQQYGGGELEPANNLRLLRQLQELSNGTREVRRWLSGSIVEVEHRFDVHASKHGLSPFMRIG